MTARSLTAHESDLEEGDPQRAIATLPPPHGAKDAYSAQTRVGTLPEHVLEAMRLHATDASLEKRTKSGMLRAAARPLTPPPPPTFSAAAPRAAPSTLATPLPTPAPTSAPVVVAPVVVAPSKAQGSALRSLVLVALFALLGAVCAAALALLGS